VKILRKLRVAETLFLRAAETWIESDGNVNLTLLNIVVRTLKIREKNVAIVRYIYVIASRQIIVVATS